MSGTEYDLIHRETLKKYTPHSVQKKNRALRTGEIGSVFVFFINPPEGMIEKGRRCSVEEEPSMRKVCIFHVIIIIHILFIKKQGDYYYE